MQAENKFSRQDDPASSVRFQNDHALCSLFDEGAGMAVEQAPVAPVLALTGARAMAGILAICGATFAFTLQDAIMKVMMEEYSLWNLLLVRLVVSVLLLSGLIAVLKGRHTFGSSNYLTHIVRGFIMSFCFIAFYAALPFMELTSIATITYAFPLFTAFFAAVFLKETVGWRRSLALVVGFAGVVVAIRPGSDLFDPVSLLPLVTAITYAVTLIMLRRLGETESTLTVALHTSIYFGLFILLNGYLLNLFFGNTPGFEHLHWDWRLPPLDDAPILLLLGLCGVAGITLASRAYQIGPASFIAPFDYVYLAWAALLGFLLWGTLPDQFTLLGMGLIVGAGIFIGQREIRLLRQAEARELQKQKMVRGHG